MSNMQLKKTRRGWSMCSTQLSKASTQSRLYRACSGRGCALSSLNLNIHLFDNSTKHTYIDRGATNRKVSSTKMNAESSRSHLILSILLEVTNKTTGAVNKVRRRR